MENSNSEKSIDVFNEKSINTYDETYNHNNPVIEPNDRLKLILKSLIIIIKLFEIGVLVVICVNIIYSYFHNN